jgi:hypothetical protein
MPSSWQSVVVGAAAGTASALQCTQQTQTYNLYIDCCCCTRALKAYASSDSAEVNPGRVGLLAEYFDACQARSGRASQPGVYGCLTFSKDTKVQVWTTTADFVLLLEDALVRNVAQAKAELRALMKVTNPLPYVMHKYLEDCIKSLGEDVDEKFSRPEQQAISLALQKHLSPAA